MCHLSYHTTFYRLYKDLQEPCAFKQPYPQNQNTELIYFKKLTLLRPLVAKTAQGKTQVFRLPTCWVLPHTHPKKGQKSLLEGGEKITPPLPLHPQLMVYAVLTMSGESNR